MRALLKRWALGLVGAVTVASASVSAQEEAWQRPVDGVVSYGYFSEAYAKSEGVQHVGVDIDAEAGEIVRAPAAGSIVINRTGRADIMNAYLILLEDGTGIEHVLAHISSNLPEKARVERGDIVGVVREWSGNEHVHWGVFRGNMMATFGNGWGFGRIPSNASASDAKSKGWLDPLAGSAAKPLQPSKTIPARYHGTWSNVNVGCRPARADHEVPLQIGPDKLNLDSTIFSVTEEGEGVVVQYRYMAEGDYYNSTARLELTGQGAGKRLVMSQDEYSFTYKLCDKSQVTDPFASYSDNFLGNEEVEVRVTESARRRDYPSTEGTTILDQLAVGTVIKGRWVKDIVNDRRWLKINTGGYVWDGVLAEAPELSLYGTWRLIAERSIFPGQKWQPIKSSEREVVTFNSNGRFASNNRRNSSGSFRIEQVYDWGGVQISGWQIYHVSAEFEGDRMIVTHHPTSAINAYERLWVRISDVGIAPTSAIDIQLTTIPRLKNDHCYSSLDKKGDTVVRYFKDDGMWTGINGRVYRFKIDDYLTGQPGIVEVSTDRQVRIKSDYRGSIESNGTMIDVRTVEVSMLGKSKSFTTYDVCPARAPSGD